MILIDHYCQLCCFWQWCDLKKVLIHLFFSLLWKSKNLFSAFRTPAVLFVLVCLLYVVSGILLFIGLSTFALVCDCTMGVVMMSMLTWAFIRYSGRYRTVGGAIDQAAGVVLEQVSLIGRWLVTVNWCLSVWGFFRAFSSIKMHATIRVAKESSWKEQKCHLAIPGQKKISSNWRFDLPAINLQQKQHKIVPS